MGDSNQTNGNRVKNVFPENDVQLVIELDDAQ